MNKLRLMVPTNVLDAASRVITALTTTALYTTDRLTQQVPGRPLARSWANFTNVFSAEVGKHQYTDLSHEAFARPLASPRARRAPLWHATQRLSLQVGTHCISTFHMSNGRVDVYTPGHLYITRP